MLDVAGAILGWHGQESGAKFFAASTFHFHPFHKSSCCHHGAKFFCSLHKSLSLFHNSSCCKYHLAPPDYGMPPWDLLPPSAGPLRRGHFVLVFPPRSLPSLVYFPGELVAASPVGQRLRPAPPCMGIFSLSTRGWFHLSCALTEQIDCPNDSVMVNFYIFLYSGKLFSFLFSFSISVYVSLFSFSLKQIFVFAFR